ncbi:prolyl oligopeptidase family serine peptidase [Miniimonas sp. S16]|uniref:S9 family peptidase n=1 Tax=Miniimonas sp. S16 TaxID=2171623 RepID=UPI000D52A257|nr:prolyl oligopeptidase family serine peptidase [Miniimonas sp. S16]
MATPFHDLDDYIAIPRLTSLALAPDGSRLVATQQALDAKRTGYVTSLWEIALDGEQPARRLTRGAKGESGAAFTATGDLLFVARRAEPGTSEADAKACVWRLPAGGGEAHVLVRRPAGVSGVLAASAAETVLAVADTLPSATDEASERDLRTSRKDAKVAAILHSGYPVRYWDHDLGPGAPRLFAVESAPLPPKGEHPEPDGEAPAPADVAVPGPDDERGTRDLTPDAGRALGDVDLAADGSFAVAQWTVPEERGASRSTLVRIDVATGERTVLVDDGVGGGDAGHPLISPDGAWVAYVHDTRTTPTEAPRVTLRVVASDGENGTGGRTLVPDWDRWATPAAWLPDSSALLVVADETGHAPLFRVPLREGASAADVVRLTGEGAYSSVVVTPDCEAALALRASYRFPAEVVRVDLGSVGNGSDGGADAEADAAVTPLRGPVERPTLPGRLEDVATTVSDPTDPAGTEVTVRGYLALPESASSDAPAPLLLWIHGGPLGSWNAWSWRWNPWLLVAQGYAVLLPDPALSTGYGRDFVQRGWGAWGEAPYTDLMAITDAVEQRADVDETRTAAMGGSFGGYMANWVAGHTDRFAAIVTHASLWALDQFGPTTDAAFYWLGEMTPEMAEKNSPHRFVASIRTPMLVIHGDKDYRVPIGEGLRLWYELLASSGLPAGPDGTTPHRFLYFPDENHWILTPQHAKVWYEVVEAFLAEHVLGQTRVLPDVLG